MSYAKIPLEKREAMQVEYEALRAQMQDLEQALGASPQPADPVPERQGRTHPLQGLIARLKTEAQLQASQEESFYTLALRLRKLGDIAKPLPFASETEMNIARRRLHSEFGRLENMGRDMQDRRARIGVLLMEFKVVPFRRSEELPTSDRDSHISAGKDLITRIDATVDCVCDLAEMVKAQLERLEHKAA